VARLGRVLRLLPLTALNDALRAVYLDGSAVVELARPLGLLLLCGTLGFGLALRIFRWE
jgi:ABC-2 type transport system permease protein